MKTNFILIKEGKAFAVCEEIPKEPEDNRTFPLTVNQAEDRIRRRELYNASLQRVKDNATLIREEDQEKAWDFMWRHDPDIHSPISLWHYRNTLGHKHDGKIKTLTASVEVEIIEACGHESCPVDAKCEVCASPVKLARIVEEPEEKKELADVLGHVLGHPDRNWTEDFPHENGRYMNKCIECKLMFMGHKRRVMCKQCQTVPDSEVEDQEEFLEKIEFIKGAFQCFVGYENHDGLKKFLKESKFSITRVNNPIK